jgi:hypothetical protein
MVNGTVTWAPFGGSSSAGAGGPAGAIGVAVGVGLLRRAAVERVGKPTVRMSSARANNSGRIRESFMCDLQSRHVSISQPTFSSKG